MANIPERFVNGCDNKGVYQTAMSTAKISIANWHLGNRNTTRVRSGRGNEDERRMTRRNTSVSCAT